MTHKEKAIELLSQMPEPYSTWALENLESQQCKCNYVKEPKTIISAIQFGFVSAVTPQGWKFWDDVQKHYMYGTPLPELPIEYRYEQLRKENEELKRKVAELESKLNTQTK